MSTSIVLSVKPGGLRLTHAQMRELLLLHPELLERFDKVDFESSNGTISPLILEDALVEGDSLLFTSSDFPRNHPWLVERVRRSPADMPHLRIVEIPSDVNWQLCVNDQGDEWIAEAHRTWTAGD